MELFEWVKGLLELVKNRIFNASSSYPITSFEIQKHYQDEPRLCLFKKIYLK